MVCELDIFGTVYYLEIVILPCRDVFSLLVEDSSRQVLHSSEFSQNATRPIQVGFFTLHSEVLIVKRNYSMDIQVGSQVHQCKVIIKSG